MTVKLNVKAALAAVKSEGQGGKKAKHPDVVHYLVEQLRSSDGGNGLSATQIAEYLTGKGYEIRDTQIHGMIYSKSAKASHIARAASFEKLVEAGNEDAVKALTKFLPAVKTEAKAS